MQMNNDNYLQDFYNYNHMPNNYNPYMNMNNPYFQNFNTNNSNMSNIPNSMQGQFFTQNGMNRNPNIYEQNNVVNLTNYYPSIYRIINPVVGRVVQNSNYQFLNEDTINNMVDTVFSIVDGQIDYSEEIPTQNAQSQTSNAGNSNQNTSVQSQRQTNSEINNQRNNANIQNNKKSDELLRDIIRILIVKELLARRNNQYVTY